MEGEQQAKTSEPHAFWLGMLLLPLLLWGAYALWVVKVDDPKQKMLFSCRHWIRIEGDVGRPSMRCIRARSLTMKQRYIRLFLEKSKPSCQLPKDIPWIAHGERISVQRRADGRCVLKRLRMRGKQRIMLGLRIDVNSATLQELVYVPGLSLRLAQRIVVYRQKYGSFAQLEALVRVRGIGPKTLTRLRPYLSVHTYKKHLIEKR